MEIYKTERFRRWIDGLRDIRARARILVRIERLQSGNSGDCRFVGDGVTEMRIHTGPGYRVYYQQRGQSWIILLAGGDKRTQARDIREAKKMASELPEVLHVR